MITVRVSEAGGFFGPVEVEEGSTVRAVLTKCGAKINVAKQIRVGMEEAELDDIVEDGETIYVVPQVTGN